jgi:hypothetical protein
MTLKQLLTSVNHLPSWDVGRSLQSDITRWRIAPVLLRAVGGFLLSGLLLAILVPLIATRGWHLSGAVVWVVILGCIAVCLTPDLRRLLRR